MVTGDDQRDGLPTAFDQPTIQRMVSCRVLYHHRADAAEPPTGILFMAWTSLQWLSRFHHVKAAADWQARRDCMWSWHRCKPCRNSLCAVQHRPSKKQLMQSAVFGAIWWAAAATWDDYHTNKVVSPQSSAPLQVYEE